MARSYRKPWIVCGYGRRWKRYAKAFANRRVRRRRWVGDGGKYKKLYEQWNICDYKMSWEPECLGFLPFWKVRSK